MKKIRRYLVLERLRTSFAALIHQIPARKWYFLIENSKYGMLNLWRLGTLLTGMLLWSYSSTSCLFVTRRLEPSSWLTILNNMKTSSDYVDRFNEVFEPAVWRTRTLLRYPLCWWNQRVLKKYFVAISPAMKIKVLPDAYSLLLKLDQGNSEKKVLKGNSLGCRL